MSFLEYQYNNQNNNQILNFVILSEAKQNEESELSEIQKPQILRFAQNDIL